MNFLWLIRGKIPQKTMFNQKIECFFNLVSTKKSDFLFSRSWHYRNIRREAVVL